MDTFISYDRITDTMMYLTDKISLNFVVSLSRKKKDGTRRVFHSEFEKQSKYIGDYNTSRTIRRSFTYYFTLDIRNDFAGGFIFRTADIIPFKMVIDLIVFPWFSGDTRVYSIIEDKLVMNGEIIPAIYTQSESRYLAIVPIVYSYDNNQYKEGVRIYINTKEVWFDITIDQLYALYYLLTHTDMYNLASSMVNYVKTPPYGINSMSVAGLGSGRIDTFGTEDEQEDLYKDNFGGKMDQIQAESKIKVEAEGNAKNFLNSTKKR